jgi:hypothetical protein
LHLPLVGKTTQVLSQKVIHIKFLKKEGWFIHHNHLRKIVVFAITTGLSRCDILQILKLSPRTQTNLEVSAESEVA